MQRGSSDADVVGIMQESIWGTKDVYILHWSMVHPLPQMVSYLSNGYKLRYQDIHYRGDGDFERLWLVSEISNNAFLIG